MNIFVLDKDPKLAAQYHCDKHVIKMITETCQLLSTWANNHNHLSPAVKIQGIIYKSYNPKHPCNLWLNESLQNVFWLKKLLGELINEYIYRFENEDNFSTAKIIYNDLFIVGEGSYRRTPFKLCMPDQYKTLDPIESYRNYYKIGKAHLLKYTKRKKPYWL